MLDLALITTAVTLIFTRGEIIERYIHRPIVGAFPSNWDTEFIADGLRCPVCVGFWTALLLGLVSRETLSTMALAYLSAVLFVCTVDWLNR